MADIVGLKPDTRAAAWMGVSVFLASWFSLVVALTGSVVGPFVFQFWVYLTMSVGWFLYVMWTRPDLVRRRMMWAWIVRRLRTADGVAAMLNGFGASLFVWATLFVDTALVTVVASATPMLFVAYRKQHDKGYGRYRRMSTQDWLLIGAAMSGMTLVTLSQTGAITGGGGWRLLCGVLLAAASAVCGSWISFRFKMGTRLHDHMADVSDGRNGELACVLAVSIVTNIPGILGGLLIGVTLFPAEAGAYLGGFVSAPVVWAVAVGVAGTVGEIAFRHANLTTTNLAVNALQYVQPVLALVWLTAFATINVVRTDLLWVGAAVVIAANAVINLRSESDSPDTTRGYNRDGE